MSQHSRRESSSSQSSIFQSKSQAGSSMVISQLDGWHDLEDVPPLTYTAQQRPVQQRFVPQSPVELPPVRRADVVASRPVPLPLAHDRRRDVSETLETLLPFAKWGAVVFLVILGGLGLTRISAGYRTVALPDTHPIEVKTLLGNKPMPGAAVTFTPVMSPKPSTGTDGGLSAGMQFVGRGTVSTDGTVSPSLTPDQPGLPQGEYIVSLSWCKVEVKDGETVTGPDRVPQIFRSPATSTLRLTVKEGDNPLISLAVVNPKSRVRRASYDHE